MNVTRSTTVPFQNRHRCCSQRFYVTLDASPHCSVQAIGGARMLFWREPRRGPSENLLIVESLETIPQNSSQEIQQNCFWIGLHNFFRWLKISFVRLYFSQISGILLGNSLNIAKKIEDRFLKINKFQDYLSGS